MLGRALANDELLSDLPIAAAVGDERDDLPFSRGEAPRA
jgi:hypothetical protein